MSPEEMKPATTAERCDALRWSVCELIDGLIATAERDLCEKYFPGVPLFETETRPDYDYASPEFMAAFEMFNRARDRARGTEEVAIRIAMRDMMTTFPAQFRPALEAALQKEIRDGSLRKRSA
jgi:hypothetical protein